MPTHWRMPKTKQSQLLKVAIIFYFTVSVARTEIKTCR